VAKMKIGVELASFRLPLRPALQAASACGADGVEIDGRGEINPEISQTGIRQLRKMLDDLRLRVSALAFRTRGGYASLEGLESRVAATKAAMELAYRLGASVVVNHLGAIPPEQDADNWRLLLEVLQDLGVHGHRVGALLAAETAGDGGQDLARLRAALPEGTLGVALNPGRLVLNGFSPLEAVGRLGSAILHVHASDAVGESRGERSHPVAPGRGAVDYPALLGALDEYGYRGYFSVQLPPVADPRSAMAEAVQYLRRL